MRLPQNLTTSPWFLFPSADDFLVALGDVSDADRARVKYLSERGLPPIISQDALATMLGINSGLIWSFIYRPHRYYRTFPIKKGKGIREITAPRVALKVIQKWLGYHFANFYAAPEHVFGFVPGKSHIQAACVHQAAEWAYSVDITNFFQSTPESLVRDELRKAGYDLIPATLLGRLCCFRGFLAQGAPSSPALSNLCFAHVDSQLLAIAKRHNCRLTRYADDIVFSGFGSIPPELPAEVKVLFAALPWRLADSKERLEPIKGRIKIHGLVVSGDKVRLTKGYRNKIRTYRHILKTKGQDADNIAFLLGHVNYSNQVSRITDPDAKDIEAAYFKEEGVRYSIEASQPAPVPQTDVEDGGDSLSEEDKLRQGVIERLWHYLFG